MMIADNDQAVGNSVERCKDESKPHQCPEEKWEDGELKIPENGKSNNNACELFYDTRSGDEWDKENDGNTSERHSCGDSNEKTKEKIRDSNRDCAANGDSVEEIDPVFFMDKNVTACDLPEIVVCYKENTYHVVKDICVDEGVPVQEKFLFGEKDSVKCSSNSDQCGSEDLMKADKVTVNPVEIKALEERNCKVDDSELCNDPKESNGDSSDESSRSFADAEGSSKIDEEDLIVSREVKNPPTQVLNPSEISLETESDENSKEEVASTRKEKALTLGDILLREDEQKRLSNDNNIDRPQEQSAPQLQDEGKESLETVTGKTEQEVSSVCTTTSQEGCKAETENQKPNYLTNESYEDDIHFSRSFGETSFSAAEAISISGHITYTGPITYSGSLSVRSDASTTSGRSFAFPILQSEWNSSPVRMAKADKRRHRRWRYSFLCCRFS